ncbi:MAG: aspartyl protease family protein [Chloroflexota bacterium]|nr:aspartyl protease family protein [Chloroflexota bacterium]
MIPYDRSIDPPAPFVEVSILHPTNGQQDTLPAKLDTGADISGIPIQIVDKLGLVTARSVPIEGYDNVRVQLPTYIIALEVAGARFRQLEVVPLPEKHVLLGRDVLNHFYARLNGPELTFGLSLTPPE